MGHFDITDRKDRDLRRCQTRAFAARLFSEYPLHPSNADIWAEVARSWDDLARLKSHIAMTEARIRSFDGES
jgi:hypothetical protein